MADEVILNNISDDAQSKQYISEVLMPKVFHDIPLGVLNTGSLGIINEYMSQCMEQIGFTSAFYFNESFITKAVLPDSIYSEAAIFNIGYSYATPSTCQFLLELKIDDIYKNAKLNADNNLYEFILDKNTKFNLSNGNIYSLDYDILIQYMTPSTSDITASIPAWNVQYIMTDDMNSVAVNKDSYIVYRVTDNWLCLFITASEYVRETHTVVNNMSNGIPNQDTVITCENNIAGFDIKYVDGEGNEEWLPHDHILPIHASINDDQPYVHYIMDNPQTIRFMYQLSGINYFVPKLNSHFEITIYTCHGKAANFGAFKQDEQPKIISESNRYPNNGNTMKASFVLTGSSGGKDIGNVETVRRETIEAYNTANIISTDHDIYEWFKTFFFKNIMYPFFYKRRDDPWGRIWAGFIALKDENDKVFKTNTVHSKIPYRVLYNNNDNTISDNEIIIPPGWLWVYSGENRYTVKPYTQGDGLTVETARTLSKLDNKFVFANPFGIRIQKDPFAIGYFNPWINALTTTSHVDKMNVNTDSQDGDLSIIYHANPLSVNITRTYTEDYYNIRSYINPTITQWINGSELASYLRNNSVVPTFTATMWNYFKTPLDLYSPNIPFLRLDPDKGYIPYDPTKTYLCCSTKNKIDDNKWTLNNIWIEDGTNDEEHPEMVFIPINGIITRLYGTDDIWGNSGIVEGVSYDDDTNIYLYPSITQNEPITFNQEETLQYYTMRLREGAQMGAITKIVVGEAYKTNLTKYGETVLYRIGTRYSAATYVNIYFNNNGTERHVMYTIKNAADILIPYVPERTENNEYVFTLDQVGGSGVVLYADMKPSAAIDAYDHYRVKFSDLNKEYPMFYIENEILPLYKNNIRVVIHAMLGGIITGWVEMQPVDLNDDGSYTYEVRMYPLNQLVDIDNRIVIASNQNGGGSWISMNEHSGVTIDASKPELMMSILIRTNDELFDPGMTLDDSFKGFRIVDQYMLDDISLIQELKEMRSVVNWGESTEPTDNQIKAYEWLMNLGNYNPNRRTIYDLREYAYARINNNEFDKMTISDFRNTASNMYIDIDAVSNYYSIEYKDKIIFLQTFLKKIADTVLTDDDVIKAYNEVKEVTDGTWTDVYNVFSEQEYVNTLNETFDQFNVNGGIEIQLTPMIAHDLMISDKFGSFVSSFTQVHKVIEPVIFNRLEGNNYLDCKLIATYGLPHSYTSDVDKNLADSYWPDLNVQIEFDVKLYNNAIASNTINELKLAIKSYFNRLTTIHTPVDIISMDNNIYISNLIDQMKDNENVAYLKFKGWYTNDKGPGGNYMNADYQAIVQKWDKLEDMPTDELTRFVPEMFILDDDNIVLNII